MGLFFTTYRVEKNEGFFFNDWVTVISGLSLEEAEKYIEDKTDRFFGDSPNDYRIVEE